MFHFFNQSSIKQITFLLIVFSGIFASVFAFLVIFNERMELKKDIERAKSEYLQNKKDIIIAQSSKIYRMIDYYSLKKKSKEELRKHVIDIMESIFKDPLEMIYPFVFTFEADLVYDPILHRHENIKLSHLKTANDKDILKKIQALSKNGGGFIEFTSFYDNKDKENKSLLFVRKSNQQNWIIGTGAYLDDFNDVIERKKKESENRITSFILKILALTLTLYAVSIMKYKLLTKRLSKELRVIDNSFNEASKTYKIIDKEKIHLNEFKEIATHANSMIATIKANTTKLKDLNTNLEKIVENKTSELKKSAQLANRLLKDQDRFIHNALHEINTPLSVILMNTELYHLNNDTNPYFQKIEAAVKVLETINEDLSYIAKKDRVIYKKEIVNFSTYLKERIDYFEDVAYQSELGFTCNIEENIFIEFNEIELSRILDNNISNAIKYSDSNTSIEIELKTQDEKAIFTIANHGEEIENIQNLFDRYYRENSARGGFGLGLNIVQAICEKNSVYIKLSSKNRYTVFRYEFYLAKNSNLHVKRFF